MDGYGDILGLEIAGRTRELGADEVAPPAKPDRIKKLRDSHHALARLLASGLHEAEVAAITGYCISRISILKDDPTFRELLAFYRANTQAATADVIGRMTSVSLEALEELRDRLETAPESFSHGTLIEVVKTLADRAGYGPMSKSQNLNVNVDIADRLAAARKRVA